MRRSILSLSILMLSFTVAGAARADDMGFAGNTIVVDTPSVSIVSYAMLEDGTFSGSDGSAGTWNYTGGILCFTNKEMENFCGPFDGTKQPGDSWEDVAWDGNGTVKLSISKGTN